MIIDGIEIDDLVAGENSFASLDDLKRASLRVLGARVFSNSTDEVITVMASEAWMNIALMPLEIADQTISSAELAATDIAALDEEARSTLIRAQIIECEFLMGGDPVEARRRAGMLSDSTGESTHFFRSRKPLQYPISRETLDELEYYVRVADMTIAR